MSTTAVAVRSTGLVTAVGLTAEASCAALRAKVTNPTETRFIGQDGNWIMAHEVPLQQPWRGLTKLAKMTAMAIADSLQHLPRDEWSHLPLLLCVAEPERPGRMQGLDDKLFTMVEEELGLGFAPGSAVVAHGRVGVAVAMLQARSWLAGADVPQVLIAATDSLLTWATLSHYDQARRLLAENNSNGFMPGEGAGALLLGAPRSGVPELLCLGLGYAEEPAHIESGEPLRGDGLASALKAAAADAGLQMHDISFRVTDVAGEHYYFKEAALAVSRSLRQRKSAMDIWHPAECTGEAGALAGISVIAASEAACRKHYANGPTIMAHWSNDSGRRAALALQYRTA